jgi:hypothetical protein
MNLAKRIPLATTCLIVINIIILGLGLVSGSQLQIIRNYGFIPYNLFHINGSNQLSDVGIREESPPSRPQQTEASKGVP